MRSRETDLACNKLVLFFIAKFGGIFEICKCFFKIVEKNNIYLTLRIFATEK